MARIIDLDGPTTQKPSNRGTRKKYKFKNNTGEPICDFYISTGPKSFLEIEWPWGSTGNPPDIRRVILVEEGFYDTTWRFDDETSVKIVFTPCIENGKEFELKLEFDDEFEPGEYIEFSPTDYDCHTIEKDNPTTTAEPETGTKELIEGLGKIYEGLKMKTSEKELKSTSLGKVFTPTLTFNKNTGKYKLSMLKLRKEGSLRKKIPIKSITRKIKTDYSSRRNRSTSKSRIRKKRG